MRFLAFHRKMKRQTAHVNRTETSLPDRKILSASFTLIFITIFIRFILCTMQTCLHHSGRFIIKRNRIALEKSISMLTKYPNTNMFKLLIQSCGDQLAGRFLASMIYHRMFMSSLYSKMGQVWRRETQ